MHRDCRVGGGLGASCSVLARVALALVDVDIAIATETSRVTIIVAFFNRAFLLVL